MKEVLNNPPVAGTVLRERLSGETVRCEHTATCRETDCIHHEPHEFGEAESLLPDGTLIVSPCDATYCFHLPSDKLCECVSINGESNEEDIE